MHQIFLKFHVNFHFFPTCSKNANWCHPTMFWIHIDTKTWVMPSMVVGIFPKLTHVNYDCPFPLIGIQVGASYESSTLGSSIHKGAIGWTWVSIIGKILTPLVFCVVSTWIVSWFLWLWWDLNTWSLNTHPFWNQSFQSS
jgi:hypothetical protein